MASWDARYDLGRFRVSEHPDLNLERSIRKDWPDCWLSAFDSRSISYSHPLPCSQFNELSLFLFGVTRPESRLAWRVANGRKLLQQDDRNYWCDSECSRASTSAESTRQQPMSSGTHSRILRPSPSSQVVRNSHF